MLFVNKVTFGKSLGHLEMGLVVRGTNLVISESEVAQSCLTLCDPMNCSSKSLHPWNFPDKRTGVGCHFLLQRIFHTQGLNPGLLYCKQMLLPSEP